MKKERSLTTIQFTFWATTDQKKWTVRTKLTIKRIPPRKSTETSLARAAANKKKGRRKTKKRNSTTTMDTMMIKVIIKLLLVTILGIGMRLRNSWGKAHLELH